MKAEDAWIAQEGLSPKRTRVRGAGRGRALSGDVRDWRALWTLNSVRTEERGQRWEHKRGGVNNSRFQ